MYKVIKQDLPESTQLLIQKPERVLESLKKLVITDEVSYKKAADELTKVKIMRKEIDSTRKEAKAPLDVGVKDVQNKFNPALAFLDEGLQLIQVAMKSYLADQEKKRQEEQRRLDDIARKEREKREAELREQARKAREKEEALRLAAAAEENKKRKRELEIQAEKAAAREKERLAAAEVVPEKKAYVPSARPEKKGTSVRENWVGEVLDMGLIPHADLLMICEVNQGKLDKLAKLVKDSKPVAGIRFFNDPIIASRTKK